MSQIPASISPLLSTIAPSPTTPQNTTTAARPVATSKMVMNPSQIQRSKLQNVPAFLNKLYNMVDSNTTNELIRWSADGTSFIVVRHEEFAKKVLPRFFKHSNFSSFVRQLNMYGFHKVPHLQNGVLSTGESERWEFSNPHFQRNQPDLLLLVTRKKGRDPEEKETGTVDLHHILDEIAAIKKHQMSISNELKNVQNDNQVLWQESIASRERHHRHQETIDKILRFLASVFSSEKNKHVVIPRKRQFLLGDGSTKEKNSKKREHIKIEDVADEEEDQPPSKYARKSPQFDISEFVNDASDLPQPSSSPSSSPSPATADLAAAIALNDQTKKDTAASLVSAPTLNSSSIAAPTPITTSIPSATTTPSASIPPTPTSTPDLSSLLNLPQFQGLVSLAQTNPALFNQLTNSNYFDVPTTTTTTATTTTPAATTTTTTTATTTTAEPFIKSETLSPSTSNPPTPPVGVLPSVPLVPTTPEDLESSLKQLASQLGFESEKYPDPNQLDYVSMDDFFNTYIAQQPSPSPSTSTEASSFTASKTD